MSVLYIHHRSLRLPDNRGLIAAASLGQVIPLFILTDEQVIHNPYFSPKSFGFMIDSLLELRHEYRRLNTDLLIYRGHPVSTIEYWITRLEIAAVVINADYTPYAKERERQLNSMLQSHNIPLYSIWDYTLVDITQVSPQAGDGYYKVFTPFYNNVRQRAITVDNTALTAQNFLPVTAIDPSLVASSIDDQTLEGLVTERSIVLPGRAGAQQYLTRFFQQGVAAQYPSGKEYASFDTSLLSAHIKFGTVSLREIYLQAVPGGEFARQLIWHDFYLSLMNGLPEDRTLGTSNYRQMNITWSPNDQLLQAWKDGRTGFPFIDAAMRQLAQTGWMHNRGRLAVSNFLVFGLHQDWREGERWFAQNLVDYDPASNNGNWQWSAQVGVDRPRSYPRVYNVGSYSVQHDPQAIYIKTWVPELSAVEPAVIHGLSTHSDPKIYLPHVVDYVANSRSMKEQYRQNM